MKRNPFETILGGIVLFAAIGFLIFSLTKIDTKKIEGYNVKVIFTKAGGLVKGSDVIISGIKVGTVSDVKLSDDFMAEVTLTLKQTIKLPQDTMAVVSSDGLMGGKFLKLEPGKSKELLMVDGLIKKTKEYKSLEDTVGELIFLATQ